eukprot:m51a1_g3719 putative beta- -xylanase (456) ;mRNA; f:462687-464118
MRPVTALCALALVLVAATTALAGPVTLPSTWSWTSSGILVDTKSDATHNVKNVKDPTIVYYNGAYHVYATIFTAAGYRMVYFNFPSFDKAPSAKWYYMDQTPGFDGYKCAPQLFYFAPQGLWYLVFQSPWPTYSTNKDPSNPRGWSTPKTFFTNMPNKAIDFWVICDDVNCYLFFSNDMGDWFRTQTKKSAFPGGWSTSFTTVLHSQNQLEYFEASWVYRLSTQKLYIAGIEGIGAGGRYYQTFTATSLDGPWTSQSKTFATYQNVKFTQSNAWSQGVSHGELIRANHDETMLLDPCSIRFLYQGLAPGKYDDYDAQPYKLGLLTSTTKIPGCEAPAPTCTIAQSSVAGASGLGSCSGSVASGTSCSVACSAGYTAVAGKCSSGSWTPAPTCVRSTPAHSSSAKPAHSSTKPAHSSVTPVDSKKGDSIPDDLFSAASSAGLACGLGAVAVAVAAM